MDSGRELKAEIEKLVVALDEKQEWTKRIEVMLCLDTAVLLHFISACTQT